MGLEAVADILRTKDGKDLFEAVCDLYEEVKFSCSYGGDSDSLLFQFGVFDWGAGEYFELDLTRQLTQAGYEIEQLRATFYFNPTAKLRSLEESNVWCNSVSELGGFIEKIQKSEAYLECRKLSPVDIKIELQNV